MAAKTLLLLTLLTVISSTSALSDDPPPSVYDILQKYGLPSNPTLSPMMGVSLLSSRNPATSSSITLFTKITGKLNVGSITDLDGIKVKRFLFWFDVDEIRVDLPSSDNIYFTVGFINKISLRRFR